MNKDEMIKEIEKEQPIAMMIQRYLDNNNIKVSNPLLPMHIEEMLNRKNYRQIADDEIVVKKREYKELKKYRTDWLNSEKMHLQAELEDTEFELGCSNRLFQKVCEEKKELEKQLEQAKQKTREILKKLKDNIIEVDFGCGAGVYEVVDMDTDELKELANELGIELE